LNYRLIFGLVASILSGLVLALAVLQLSLPFYTAWVVALALTTFLLYGLDKRLAQSGRQAVRVPELVLNLLALAGGFAGAWAGRHLFRHKTNLERHRGMFIVLVLSTLLHGLFICGPSLLRI
jgi:uncharacterized membrane protein YsdA (DUF1294 family)